MNTMEFLRAIDTSKIREVRIDRLGYYLDGAFGAASASTKFDFSFIGLTVYCLMETRCSQKLLQILTQNGLTGHYGNTAAKKKQD